MEISSPPIDKFANTALYNKNIFDWKADVHLIGTYIFLGQMNVEFLPQKNTNYYINKFTYDFFDVAGSKIVEIKVKIW